jgi:general secretion pathway protein G
MLNPIQNPIQTPINAACKLSKIHKKGFTFIELMVVMAMIATIISIAMPRYFQGLERTKETALKQNLKEMREAIDQYHADKGAYPASLQALVSDRYLRFIPIDPITDTAESWQLTVAGNNSAQVYDVKSGAQTRAIDGSQYAQW